MHVKQLVPNLPVERLDVRVLRRLARGDKMRSYAALAAPAKHRQARKLRAVVHPKRGRHPHQESRWYPHISDGGNDLWEPSATIRKRPFG